MMPKRITKNQQRGFTLIELLVSISLIAILTGVLFAVINARGIQSRARDAQRVSDLAKVKVALESYFSDTRHYPVNADWVAVDNTAVNGLTTALKPLYINAIPTDPQAINAVCTNSAWRGYAYKSDGATYLLVANMELQSSEVTTCPSATLSCDCTYPATGGFQYAVSVD